MAGDMDTRSQLDRAWLLRLNQRLDDALMAYAELRDPIRALGDSDADIELEVLHASLFRARGETERANASIRLAQERCLSLGVPLPSRLLIERGLNSYYMQDYSSAFDDFLIVISRGESENNLVLRAQAILNALLCTEYLSLGSRSLEAQFEGVFARLEARDVSGLTSQWEAFEIRRFWARGQFEEIAFYEPTAWNQATHHVRYLGSLPFLSQDTLPSVDLAEILRKEPELYLRSYRIRTLTGQNLAEDLSAHKVSEAAERIYLWTWYWLAGQEMQLEKIVPYIEGLAGQLGTLRLTQMDQELFLLSLKWLSIFSPTIESFRRDLAERFAPSPHREPFAFMEYEKLVQNWVDAKLRGDAVTEKDLRAILRVHPLNESDGHYFKWVLQFEDDDHAPVAMRPFLKRLTARWSEITDTRHSQIVVDLNEMRVMNHLTGETVLSEPLSLALKLLKEKNSVSCAEFLESCFQQRGYDDYVHAPRVFNLLARVRSVVPPNLGVAKKGEWVHARGNWDVVRVTGSRELAHISLPAPSPIRPDSGNVEWIRELVSLNKSQFTRRDIEMKVQLSRATVNRLLRNWIREGWVEARGAGPARRYVIGEKWRALRS